MYRILLIEDDRAIADITSYFLKLQKNYTVFWAKTGSEALAYARECIDLIIMDILLPDTNGIDLCKTLRTWHKCPIIFSSCLDDTDTVVRALEMGGDDFIAKPFDNKVLLARIQANLRRVRLENQKSAAAVYTFTDFMIDTSNSKLFVKGAPVRLSRIEYHILNYFIQNQDRYLTAEDIYNSVWGEDSMGDVRTVQVHIHNIRKKIEPDPANPVYLISEWGKGYIFRSQ